MFKIEKFNSLYIAFLIFGFPTITFVSAILSLENLTIYYRIFVSAFGVFVIISNCQSRINKSVIIPFAIIFLVLVFYTLRLVQDLHLFDFGASPQDVYLRYISFVLLPTFACVFIKKINHVTKYALPMIFIIIIGSIGQLLLGGYEYRLSGNYMLNPISLGNSLAMSIIILITHYKSALKLLYISPALLMLYATLSRGALLSFLTYTSISLRPAYAIILLFVLGFIYFNGFAGSEIFGLSTGRLAVNIESINNGEGEARVILWYYAVLMIADHPIWGSHLTTEIGYVHNVYLEVLMSIGVILGGLFIVVIFGTFIRCISVIRGQNTHDAKLIASIFILISIQNLFSGTFYNAELLLPFLILVINQVSLSKGSRKICVYT